MGTGSPRFQSQLEHLVPELSPWRSDLNSHCFGEDFKVCTQGLVHRKPLPSSYFFPLETPQIFI